MYCWAVGILIKEDVINSIKDLDSLFDNENVFEKSLDEKDIMKIMLNLGADSDRTFERTKKTKKSEYYENTALIPTTYDKLIKLFGNPYEIDDDYIIPFCKTFFMWVVKQDDGHILTISDKFSGLTKEELKEEKYIWYICGDEEQDAIDLIYFIYKNTI